MLSQILLHKEKKSESTKEIKVVIESCKRLDDVGRVITLSIPDEDYKYLQDYCGSCDGCDHKEQIYNNAMSRAGIPVGYRVSAVFKGSLREES